MNEFCYLYVMYLCFYDCALDYMKKNVILDNARESLNLFLGILEIM